MKPLRLVLLLFLWLSTGLLGCAQTQNTPADGLGMAFFITSAGPGNGADLGGLEGADAHCQALADAVGTGGKTWRAYLSMMSTDGSPAVNARDRIGTGPWYNQ